MCISPFHPERLPQSIYLRPAKNASNKCISREKPNRAREQTIDQARQKAVAEEQHARNESLNMQPSRVVPDAVGEDPEGTGAADEEALPPPVVVLENGQLKHTRLDGFLDIFYLGAELNVCRDDGDLADSDHQDGTDNAQEAENVVVTALVLPQALEHKHELDEENGKGDQAGKQCSGGASTVPRLDWDLPSNRVGLGRMAPRFGSDVAVPASRIDEGHLNQEP
jgi:hypothetical protein